MLLGQKGGSLIATAIRRSAAVRTAETLGASSRTPGSPGIAETECKPETERKALLSTAYLFRTVKKIGRPECTFPLGSGEI